MLAAPFGVMALLANLIVASPSKDIFVALLGYMLTVVAGLVFMIFIFYPLVVKFFTGKSPFFFLKTLPLLNWLPSPQVPVQLLCP